MDTEELIEHVRGLQAKSIRADQTLDRAVAGLRFALGQREVTRGFPNSEYWQGKIDAYVVMIELLTEE